MGSRRCGPKKESDHALESCLCPAASAEVAFLRPQLEDDPGLPEEQALPPWMRNRIKASEEQRPGADVGGRSLRRQDVEQDLRAAALALAEHREAERGGQNSQLDEEDK